MKYYRDRKLKKLFMLKEGVLCELILTGFSFRYKISKLDKDALEEISKSTFSDIKRNKIAREKERIDKELLMHREKILSMYDEAISKLEEDIDYEY